jgi:hypothetical protein
MLLPRVASMRLRMSIRSSPYSPRRGGSIVRGLCNNSETLVLGRKSSIINRQAAQVAWHDNYVPRYYLLSTHVPRSSGYDMPPGTRPSSHSCHQVDHPSISHQPLYNQTLLCPTSRSPRYVVHRTICSAFPDC